MFVMIKKRDYDHFFGAPERGSPNKLPVGAGPWGLAIGLPGCIGLTLGF